MIGGGHHPDPSDLVLRAGDLGPGYAAGPELATEKTHAAQSQGGGQLPFQSIVSQARVTRSGPKAQGLQLGQLRALLAGTDSLLPATEWPAPPGLPAGARLAVAAGRAASSDQLWVLWRQGKAVLGLGAGVDRGYRPMTQLAELAAWAYHRVRAAIEEDPGPPGSGASADTSTAGGGNGAPARPGRLDVRNLLLTNADLGPAYRGGIPEPAGDAGWQAMFTGSGTPFLNVLTQAMAGSTAAGARQALTGAVTGIGRAFAGPPEELPHHPSIGDGSTLLAGRFASGAEDLVLVWADGPVMCCLQAALPPSAEGEARPVRDFLRLASVAEAHGRATLGIRR